MNVKRKTPCFSRGFRSDRRFSRPWKGAECQLSGFQDEVLDELNAQPPLKDRKCVDLPRYIAFHKQHIDYPEYIKQGLFIGSGAIESGNKIVAQRRLKQAGMRWEPNTAQYLLSIKAKVESGLWETEVVPLIREHYNCPAL